MQILTTLSGSGKLGGVVGNRSRHGLRLSARTAHTQPRTVPQTAQRARLGSMAGAWRALTPAQQTAWNELASITTWTNNLGQVIAITGYALFVSVTAKAINQAMPLPVTTGNIIIEQQGVEIAVTTGIEYEQQGEAIAGAP